jgi:branched-chain amino acid transport system substrate-binding protein
MKNIGLCLTAALTLSATMSFPAGAEVLIGVPLASDPETSDYSRQTRASADLAAADLNAKGGVLGEQLRLIYDIDQCKGEPAATVAEKFVEQGVIFVAGHVCSGAAISASKVYENAGVLMISGTAFDPRLTEDGGTNVFRICGRSDKEGEIAASYLAGEWAGKNIAILHDGEAYGQGLAEATKANLNSMGMQEALFEQYTPGRDDYSDLVAKMKAAGIDLVYIGGYDDEIGLIIRQAREQGMSRS